MTKGFYGGGTVGFPWAWGLGAGLYFDNHQNFYPQIYYGTPGIGISAGYSPDLENFLTGTSVSGSFGDGRVQYNIGTSGGSAGTGVSIGTPGAGMTYGFGPYRLFPASAGHSNGEDSFGDRFGNWASTPANSVAQAVENRPDLFNQRFGNWNSAPTSGWYSPSSPVLRELLKYRAAAPDNPVLSPDETSSARPTFQLDAMPSPTGESVGISSLPGDENPSGISVDELSVRRRYLQAIRLCPKRIILKTRSMIALEIGHPRRSAAFRARRVNGGYRGGRQDCLAWSPASRCQTILFRSGICSIPLRRPAVARKIGLADGSDRIAVE